MASLYWEVEAAQTYRTLSAERRALVDAVEDVLDLLDDDPGSQVVRQGSLRTRSGITLWRVRIRPRSDDWSLAWMAHPTLPDGVIVTYLGPASFDS